MKRSLNDIMERVAQVLPRLAMFLGLIGVLVGSAIMITCAGAGLGANKGGKIGWGSTGLVFLEGFAGFLIVAVFCAFFVGTIYLLVRTSEDVHALRKEMESHPKARDPRGD